MTSSHKTDRVRFARWFCTIVVNAAFSIRWVAAADVTSAPPVTDHYFNCGVNVTCEALHAYGRTVDVDKIAADLHVGDRFERNCSLADVKRCLEGNGLSVQALKFQHVDQLSSVTPLGAVLVVRTDTEQHGSKVGHFGIVLGAADRVILVDWPRPQRTVAKSALISDEWFARATGEFLVVTSGKEVVTAAVARIVIPERIVDLGRIALTTDEIEGKVAIRNEGGADLKIEKVTGPCSCFQGASGDLVIGPGKTGTMIVRFDRKKMPTGPLERTLHVQTNDPATPMVEITLKMLIGDASAVDEVQLTPRVLSPGRTSAGDMLNRPAVFTLTLPAEADGHPSKVRAELSTSVTGLTISQLRDEEFRDHDDSLSRVLKFSVGWSIAPPAGRFDHEVRFTVERQGRDPITMKVPVSGDALSE